MAAMKTICFKKSVFTLMQHTTIHSRYRHFETFIKSLPSAFATGGVTLYEGRNVVKSFTTGGVTLVVKRFKKPNIVQAIGYALYRPGKARRAYAFAAELRKRGFLTPQEVAFVEVKDKLLIGDSFFVSEECLLPPLSTLLRRVDFDRGVADDLAAEMVRMHERGVLHGDLNLTNILYERREDGHCRFTFIDTNRSHFTDSAPGHKACIANLMRLSHDKSLLEYVIGRYAAMRGWNEKQTVGEVMASLDRFERRREMKRRIKSLLGLKRKKRND